MRENKDGGLVAIAFHDRISRLQMMNNEGKMCEMCNNEQCC